MSNCERSDGCAYWSSHREANHASAHCTQERLLRFGLLSLLDRHRGASFSIPPARRAGGLSAFVEIAQNAGRLEVVEVIRPAFGARHRMFNVPRPSLAVLAVIFTRQLRVTNVAVATRLAVNLIQLLFRESHVHQLLFYPWQPKPSAVHGLFNPGYICHVPHKKLRTAIADNRCPHRDLCRDFV
jgi:hypothetical protein